MIYLDKGRYDVQQAKTQSDLDAAQVLRAQCFGRPHTNDIDAYDTAATHMLVHDVASGTLVCCFRISLLTGERLTQSYSAQFYELSALSACKGPMMELGRFCVHPDWHDPDILRVAWAAMTAAVDKVGVQMIFGCASFAGVETEQYLDAFAMLKARYLAPKRWLPQVKSPDVFRFAAKLRRKPDAKKGMLRMPPLLRSYLMMGGRVSDHAVVDRQMGTLHVFTGLEIGAIPVERKRLLRALV
ncbi:ornithine-acyl-ACP acyltransferase [Sulfitobacter sp. SK012]|uniref:GNAT family N-acetyltransferase n=1 Tax=Sulfitobacter sp. SK012 TaxID=1389005 RepID=UPI000E0B282B|nr:GNAT family N-acetyltransferase [Sulfitobacter sp. SK012]AXI46218.1 ornithine-acyl-ACP acyltransferase [Sulfitobacter sp. SK012]